MKKLLTALAVAMATLTATASTTLAENKPIYFNSFCSDPIENLVIRHRTTSDDSWHSHGFWDFAPYEEAYITNNNRKYYHDTDYSLYFYAESNDGTWSGDHERQYNGIFYPMRKAKTREYPDRLEVRLRCD